MPGRLRIAIVTPAARRSTSGNRVTALRWAGMLRSLGHRVRLGSSWDDRIRSADVLVALHARKSHEVVARFSEARPEAPLVVALTGTDLYQDLPADPQASRSVALATRLVVLQEMGVDALSPSARHKARVIHQSASKPTDPLVAPPGTFQVCLLAHIRAVKDPHLAARAARGLPESSRIVIVHAGAALEPGAEAEARRNQAEVPRYRWLGGVSRRHALRVLAGSRLLVLTSRLEGGANAASEAIACGIPIVSSRVAGSVGMLGAAYPGFFEPGDANDLARVLARVETDPELLARLTRWSRDLAPMVDPARERSAWRLLLAELA